jgi:hypothetical protein
MAQKLSMIKKFSCGEILDKNKFYVSGIFPAILEILCPIFWLSLI